MATGGSGSSGLGAYEIVTQVSPAPPGPASRTDNYDVLATLGRGTYGVCYKVQRKDTGEVCVMKAVSLAGLADKDVEDTLNEARLMHRLAHPNIIRHIDSWCENQWLFIIMEYAAEGDLGAVVAAGGGAKAGAPEADIRRYIADIGLGLQYLHQNCVLHRWVARALPRPLPHSGLCGPPNLVRPATRGSDSALTPSALFL